MQPRRTIRVPGVYRGVRARTAQPPRPRTDVACFIGVAGPNHVHAPRPVNDWRQYAATFLTDALGAPLEPPPGSRLTDAVRAYFANGGQRCWIVNLAEAIDPTDPLTLLLDTLGHPRSGSPVDDAGNPLPRGIEAALRIPEIAIIDVPVLFATVTEDVEVPDARLPPRSEEGSFARCTEIRDVSVISGLSEPSVVRSLFEEQAIATAQRFLLERCHGERWRVFLLLATPAGLDPDAAIRWREALGTWDGAALYWPWVLTQEVPGDPTRLEPPTGAAAGIFSQLDLATGPHRAPAGTPVLGIVGTEREVPDRIQAEVYPSGLNSIRSIAGRGMMLWGARTLRFEGIEAPGDSTPDTLAYINVRRCLSAIERAANRIGQSAVFQAHTVLLRLQVSQAIRGHLTDLFDAGVLQGSTTEQAFFVRCDSDVNPPSVVDAGQLICEVGVAIAAPAEFIVFRVGRREGVVEIEEI